MIPYTEKKKEICWCCCLNSKTKKEKYQIVDWNMILKNCPEDIISSSLTFSLFLQCVISPSRQQKNLEMFPLSSESLFGSGLFC